MKVKIFSAFMLSVLLAASSAIVVFANENMLREDFRDSIDRAVELYQELVVEEMTIGHTRDADEYSTVATFRRYVDMVRGVHTDAGAANRSGFEPVSMSETSEQIERLWALTLREQSVYEAASRTMRSSEIPRITFFATPEPRQPEFWIGLYAEPTEQDIEFILEFTGIPRERAVFGQSRGAETRDLTLQKVDINDPSHRDFVSRAYQLISNNPRAASSISEEERMLLLDLVRQLDELKGIEAGNQLNSNSIVLDSGEISPLVTQAMIGSRIMIITDRARDFTLGHPTNRLGRSFFTTVHANIFPPNGPVVWLNGFDIGDVQWSTFNSRFDVTLVNSVPRFTMSPVLPRYGREITNFRGFAQVDHRVVSFGATTGITYKGIVSTTGVVAWPERGGVTADQILTFPDVTQVGDSGSALILIDGTRV